MTAVLNRQIDAQLKALQDISLRAEWLTDQNAWTQQEFDGLVAKTLEVGDVDNLEPLFNLSPQNLVRAYIKQKAALIHPLNFENFIQFHTALQQHLECRDCFGEGAKLQSFVAGFEAFVSSCGAEFALFTQFVGADFFTLQEFDDFYFEFGWHGLGFNPIGGSCISDASVIKSTHDNPILHQPVAKSTRGGGNVRHIF
jgi:hypothetical protein